MNAQDRCFGILLPVFSLPGNGDFDAAGPFVEFLAEAGAAIWQVLPLGPTHADGSPYLSLSSRAGNPGFCGAGLSEQLGLPEQLQSASESMAQEFQKFCQQEADWLDGFALYMALREHFEQRAWFDWPEPLRTRQADALAQAEQEHPSRISEIKWQQFVFFQQWQHLRSLANHNGIQIFGDIPLYVAHDSADVWQHQSLFQLDEAGSPLAVAGVPPDYFSPTGQRWGNPLYDWDAMAADGFSWWIDRMNGQSQLYDIVRIDHFRGLEAFWSVPASSPTAEVGEWIKAPGQALLRQLQQHCPNIRFVAEDLGVITPEVEALRNEFALPGMHVVQFGFDGLEDNEHHPSNTALNSVVYTGTHDNDTSVGWYATLEEWQKVQLLETLSAYPGDFPLNFVACVFDTVANTAIIPIQDLLGLGTDSRINVPGTVGDNWRWQLPEGWPQAQVIAQLQSLKASYHR